MTENTDARRRASAAYFKKREAAGLRRATFWLTPGTIEALERLAQAYGSKDSAVNAAILLLGAPKAQD